MMKTGTCQTQPARRRMNVAEKFVFHTEAFVKGMLFDCQTCGQCVLSKTSLICPMSCPKGLRNGPCGGTLDGKCEVYPESRCVWVRIHEAKADMGCSPLPILPPPDYNLFKTASYVNFVTGADKDARTPLPPLELGRGRTLRPPATASRLEAALKSGRFVRTCEIRSPRENDWKAFRRDAEIVRAHFDAVNATAYLNGRPSVSSVTAASKLAELGVDAITQATSRDHTRTTFVSELIGTQGAGVANMLVLTGDAFVGGPKLKQVYDMDSSVMLYEARHLRETGRIRFTGASLKNPPKIFLGAAINPFTDPEYVPVRRLAQKAEAGADFIQTQLIFDMERFRRFMALVCENRIDRELFILAGIPVVISKTALAMVPHIPGVRFPEEIRRRLEGAADLRAEGIRFAQELVRQAQDTPGVSGVHLMLFGADHSVLPEVASVIRDDAFEQTTTTQTTHEQKDTPCHSRA